MRTPLAPTILTTTTTPPSFSRAASPGADGSRKATGIVFRDENRNGIRGANEAGLEGILVSNGRAIVKTNPQGRYELPVGDDTILFVIKPRNWTTPVDANQLPKFYYIHKPMGSPAGFRFPGVKPTGPLPASVDFPLHPNQEPDTFKALFFGNTQPRNIKEVEYIAHDVIEPLVAENKRIGASFGVTLGDVAFDNLTTFEPSTRSSRCSESLGTTSSATTTSTRMPRPTSTRTRERVEVEDPAYVATKAREDALLAASVAQEEAKRGETTKDAAEKVEQAARPPNRRQVMELPYIPLPDTIKSPHIWRALLPPDPAPGTHAIHVRTTDMFGHKYTDRRSIKIE